MINETGYFCVFAEALGTCEGQTEWMFSFVCVICRKPPRGHFQQLGLFPLEGFLEKRFITFYLQEWHHKWHFIGSLEGHPRVIVAVCWVLFAAEVPHLVCWTGNQGAFYHVRSIQIFPLQRFPTRHFIMFY